ncbi:MAG: hypothetical protein R3F03_08795 [Opitutaceae bacterium]
MAFGSNPEQTYPHDYRLICAGRESPTVVGGQAVNLWAISYLGRKAPDLRARHYGSKDLDVLADKKVLAHLKTIPGWVFKPNAIRNWTDSRQGFLHGTSEDGRKLLVEVLHSVHGLDKEDLKHVETLEHRGHQYRLLDPIVMMKAKAANVRDFKQDDIPPRHDRQHLQLLARCVPPYLREIHRQAVENPVVEKDALAVISRAFKTLQHSKTTQTLLAEKISPVSLIPVELGRSPVQRIQAAYTWQFPRLARVRVSSRPQRSGIDPPFSSPSESPQGPRMRL